MKNFWKLTVQDFLRAGSLPLT